MLCCDPSNSVLGRPQKSGGVHYKAGDLVSPLEADGDCDHFCARRVVGCFHAASGYDITSDQDGHAACPCSAVHIVTIYRVALHLELVNCRPSCVCEVYDSGCVFSAETIQLRVLVVKPVYVILNQLFTCMNVKFHEQLTHSVHDGGHHCEQLIEPGWKSSCLLCKLDSNFGTSSARVCMYS